jgi:hypothetical protein
MAGTQGSMAFLVKTYNSASSDCLLLLQLKSEIVNGISWAITIPVSERFALGEPSKLALVGQTR